VIFANDVAEKIRTRISHGLTGLLLVMSNHDPAYSTARRAAAAALKIGIYQLRGAKRQECPAFRVAHN
jgi:hypothetical protein